MTKHTFAFAVRVKLIGIIDSAQAQDGGLEKLMALMSVYKKVKFTDAERERIETKDTPNGTLYVVTYPCCRCEKNRAVQESEHLLKCVDCGTTYPLPTQSFGIIEVELESDETRWLQRQIDIWKPNARVADLEWLLPLQESLAAKERK